MEVHNGIKNYVQRFYLKWKQRDLKFETKKCISCQTAQLKRAVSNSTISNVSCKTNFFQILLQVLMLARSRTTNASKSIPQ